MRSLYDRMERLFQDDFGTIDFLSGSTIQQILCVYWQNELKGDRYIGIFWLKEKEKSCWLRFFIDAGIAVAEQYSLSEFEEALEDDTEETEDYFCNYSAERNLENKTILSAFVEPIGNEGGVRLSFILNSNQKLNIQSDIFDGKMKIELISLRSMRSPN